MRYEIDETVIWTVDELKPYSSNPRVFLGKVTEVRDTYCKIAIFGCVKGYDTGCLNRVYIAQNDDLQRVFTG